jgi:hypothetical protein
MHDSCVRAPYPDSRMLTDGFTRREESPRFQTHGECLYDIGNPW